MKLVLFLGTLVGLILISCEPSSRTESFDFFKTGLEKHQGIASKYYVHMKSKDGSVHKIDIKYLLFTQYGERRYRLESFNAGLQKINHVDLRKDNEKYFIEKEYSISQDRSIKTQGDTTFRNLIDSLWLDCSVPFVKYSKSWSYMGSLFQRDVESNGVQDTIINERPAKIISGQYVQKHFQKTDTTTTLMDWQSIFVDGLGRYAFMLSGDDGSYEYELVEEIPEERFIGMLNHDRHRIAYIDTLKTLEGSPHVKPCFGHQQVFDYYNDDDAGYKGGKGRFIRDFTQKLDENTLGYESGYLSFRFIINCKGEAGHFVCEESDLNLEEKDFSQETKKQILNVLSSLDQWKPLKINGEERDAYFYISLKLNKGEIIDILP